MDDVWRTITGTGQSLPNRLSNVPVVTASISEPVSSEQRVVDPQISSENFPMAVIPSPNAELPRVEDLAVISCTSATFANQSTSGSRVTPSPNY
ncbi:hypothetical protein RND71_038835 [Anisodus tanguticus]|uniref:Uncharacterized protein n=1 Tax=Anisodus tanguticus TaxID=243964 RepID=A0AAE1QZT0_9SOLA|nr:hypothetical protein RND71_038835 [Anisodus tanguticus]